MSECIDLYNLLIVGEKFAPTIDISKNLTIQVLKISTLIPYTQLRHD